MPAWQQAAEKRPVRLVSIPDSWRQLIQDKYDYLGEVTVPAGTYAGQDQPAVTVGPRTILVMRRDLTVDLAYVLAKALVEGKAELEANSTLGKAFDPRAVTEGVNTPFHVGALDYYREVGLSK